MDDWSLRFKRERKGRRRGLESHQPRDTSKTMGLDESICGESTDGEVEDGCGETLGPPLTASGLAMLAQKQSLR